MRDQELLKTMLRDSWLRARDKNPSYSLRAFAARLGVGAPALSEFFAGKRRFAPALVKRVVVRLGCEEGERAALLAALDGQPNRKPTASRETERSTLLTMNQFHVIANWYCFAIVSLLETRKRGADAGWVAQRLGLTAFEAKSALQRLTRLDVVSHRAGRYRATGKSLVGPDGVSDAVIRRSHQQHLTLASRALEEVPFERRDFTSVTLAIDPRRLEKARALTRAYHRRMMRLLETGRKTDVYKLCVQLFPVSKPMPSTQGNQKKAGNHVG